MRFAYRLAKELGIWDVAGMLNTMTADQFYEWSAYSELEPFGEERADMRSGVIAATIANVNTPRNGKKYSASDFMPKFGAGDTRAGARKPLTKQSDWERFKRAAAQQARAK